MIHATKELYRKYVCISYSMCSGSRWFIEYYWEYYTLLSQTKQPSNFFFKYKLYFDAIVRLSLGRFKVTILLESKICSQSLSFIAVLSSFRNSLRSYSPWLIMKIPVHFSWTMGWALCVYGGIPSNQFIGMYYFSWSANHSAHQ